MTISPEAKEAAESIALMFYSPDKPHKFEERAERSIQLAINYATAQPQKEIERLRVEVEKAWDEGFTDPHDEESNEAWTESRAKRVAEGVE